MLSKTVSLARPSESHDFLLVVIKAAVTVEGPGTYSQANETSTRESALTTISCFGCLPSSLSAYITQVQLLKQICN